MVEELTGGTVKTTYVYGLARISQTQVAGAVTSYYGYDGHGDVRYLTDVTGKVTDTYDYDAFGNLVGKTGATANVYRYQGEAFDAETGLYYLRARYYDPAAGRFLSVDPLADQGQHPYAYAGADPVNGHDPTGTQDVLEFGMMLAAFMPRVGVFVGMREDIKCLWGVTKSVVADPRTMIGRVAGCAAMFADPRKPGGGGGSGPGTPGNDRPKIGIGIEVPKASAIENGVLNVESDPGHTFVYFKDKKGNVVSLLSFGPGPTILFNQDRFFRGMLPGTAHWPLKEPVASTWESYITEQQLSNGRAEIADFRQHVPNFTPRVNCTSSSRKIAFGIGINIPDGVGPARAYDKWLHQLDWGPENIPNPYTLSNELTAQYGRGYVVPTSAFPKP